jgi:hypothetical protein
MIRRFDFLDTFMKEKMSNLDVIDKLNDIFDKFEKELVEMKSEINEIKKLRCTVDDWKLRVWWYKRMHDKRVGIDWKSHIITGLLGWVGIN